jgi:hypothetical protein
LKGTRSVLGVNPKASLVETFGTVGKIIKERLAGEIPPIFCDARVHNGRFRG